MSFQSLSIEDQIGILESVLDERRAATKSHSVIKNGVYVSCFAGGVNALIP
jgi:hypothetical protein